MANARIVSSSKWKELICNDEIQMLGTASAKRNARVKDTLIFCTLSLWFLSFKKPITHNIWETTQPSHINRSQLCFCQWTNHGIFCFKFVEVAASATIRTPRNQWESDPSSNLPRGDKQITNPNLPLPYDLPNHQFSGANMFVFSLGKLDTLWYLLPGC